MTPLEVDPQQLAVSPAELTYLCRTLALQVLPTVLSIELDAALAADDDDPRVPAELARRGIIDDDRDIDYPTAAALRTLSNPDWSVQARRVDQQSMLRICLAGRADHAVLAVRDGDDIVIEPVHAETDEELVIGALTPYVGVGQPARVEEFRCPSDALDRLMATARTGQEYATSFAALGATDVSAGQLATLLISCVGQTEIVAYRRDRSVPRVVAIIDTRYGRIVSSACPSADGTRWTSISPGSAHRVTDALAQLVHQLPEGG